MGDLLQNCSGFINYLKEKDDILFLTTSNRYEEHTDDIPKSTQLAFAVRRILEEKNITILDVPKLNIYTCEGNISAKRGNRCGMPDAALKDKERNPTGHHRCWASFNHDDDELDKITRVLFESKVLVFFVSMRWGQTNSVYQRLFERLSWIENRVTTLGEEPIPQIAQCEAGIVLFGHNWRGAEVLATQKQNFKWFGFQVPDELSFNWQYTDDPEMESAESYIAAREEFEELVNIEIPRLF
jgi:hypothetical protein